MNKIWERYVSLQVSSILFNVWKGAVPYVLFMYSNILTAYIIFCIFSIYIKYKETCFLCIRVTPFVMIHMGHWCLDHDDCCLWLHLYCYFWFYVLPCLLVSTLASLLSDCSFIPLVLFIVPVFSVLWEYNHHHHHHFGINQAVGI